MELLTDQKIQLEQYLTSGCDERIYLNKDGLTKYWIDPLDYRNMVHRGSCTCGTLNPETEALMEHLIHQDLDKTEKYEALLDEQTDTLKSLINYEGLDEFEVFYAPSGSDLVYFPISFCQILHPERPMLNILSCPEELGSGTLHAVKGEYHANFNQFEEPIKKGAKVHPDFNIKVVSLTARSDNGKIINHEAYIKEQINQHPDHSIIVSLVYGSKSGIEDNLDIINKIDREDIIWTIDMCQFRHSREFIHNLLSKNGCVMITGSKFYQAPPFCGSLLINQKLMDKLKAGDLTQFSKLKTVLSAYDFPKSIRHQVNIPFKKNIGLRLRWACSLDEIKKFKQIPKEQVRAKIKAWNTFINKKMNASDIFELMPDQSMTNNTIISFRVKKNGQFLDHETLKELHRLVVCEGDKEGLGNQKVFIGQPVAYGEKSFLRVAIGSMNIRAFVEHDETEFEEDNRILSIIKLKLNSIEEN
ncbi:MAG: hypothetical protein R2753_16340 [Chitinophagales bacterium]